MLGVHWDNHFIKFPVTQGYVMVNPLKAILERDKTTPADVDLGNR